MIVKLLKEKKAAESAAVNQERVFSDAKLLLAGDVQEDSRIMNELAPNSAFAKTQDRVGRQMELERHDEQYGNVFTKAQIRDLCIKYRLRFLSSIHFQGDIDIVAVQKMKEFAKRQNIELTKGMLQTQFCIMAPVELFELQDRPAPVDPLLFYNIDGKHFRLIHNWGKDFTPFRRLMGWKFESARNRVLSNILMFGSIALILLVWAHTHEFGSLKNEVLTQLFSIAGFIASIIGPLIASTEHDRNKLSPRCWDSIYKS